MRYPRGRRLFDSLDRAAGVLVFAKDGHSLAAYEISGDITKKLSAARAVPTSAPIKEQEAQTMGNVDISPEISLENDGQFSLKLKKPRVFKAVV